MTTERKAFKDYFDRAAARALAEQLARGQASLDVKTFVAKACKDLDELEMMDRVRQFSAAMRQFMPTDPRAAYSAIAESLPDPLPDCDNVTDGYLLWPVGQFILETASPEMERAEVDAALECMTALTQRFTAEYAVRPFVAQHPEAVFAEFEQLTSHSSPHVRRWCSEGIRPRLPWGRRLEVDPARVIAILDQLKDDPERYVQKSVANNLNDLAKDDPDLVLEVAHRWLEEDSPRTRWIVRQGLRSLIKEGHPRALELFGYGPPSNLDCRLSVEPQSVVIGDSAQLSLEIQNRHHQAQSLLIDYVVHYVKANGSSRPKVFKWTTLELNAGDSAELNKSQPFRHVSIRRLHAGSHRIEVQINGSVVTETQIELRSPP